jgi:hypothetical protein
MAIRPILPRGSGLNRGSFESWLNSVADYYEQRVEEVYVKEMEVLLNDIIQHTPIATGAAAGVESNLVGDAHVTMTNSHPAYSLQIGNGPGDSGWQLEVDQSKGKLRMAIFNPMWKPYLEFLEYGIVTPADPRAKSHFVHDAVQRHLARREEISREIDNG